MPEKTPFVPAEIVEWLSKIFPLAMPSEGDSDRQIWMAVGTQRVVKKLRQVSDEQAKNVLQQQ
ncbi:MAG: hypothetical protein WD802_04460 [Gemmatimonadaceae bacterium]